jgi:hypothetical protein
VSAAPPWSHSRGPRESKDDNHGALSRSSGCLRGHGGRRLALSGRWSSGSMARVMRRPISRSCRDWVLVSGSKTRRRTSWTWPGAAWVTFARPWQVRVARAARPRRSAPAATPHPRPTTHAVALVLRGCHISHGVSVLVRSYTVEIAVPEPRPRKTAAHEPLASASPCMAVSHLQPPSACWANGCGAVGCGLNFRHGRASGGLADRVCACSGCQRRQATMALWICIWMARSSSSPAERTGWEQRLLADS